MCKLTRALAIIALFATQSAHGQPTDSKVSAASAFDRGVAAFEKADYAAAARAFLLADAAVPNPDALSNALVAAERAGEHLLVVEAAERATSREETSPELAARARQALRVAAQKLSLVELSCQPTPCALRVDGTEVIAGERYLLPGTHRFEAIGAAGGRVEENLKLDVGARYRVVLHWVEQGTQPRATTVQRTSGPPAAAARPAAEPEPRDRGPSRSRPLSPTVFYVGVGASVVLAGITTWSGLDTLTKKRELGAAPTTKQVDGVEGRVVRTDVLLAGTVLVTGATVLAGLTLVDWGSDSAAVAAHPGGARLTWKRRF